MQWAWILLTSWLLMSTTTWWRLLPLLARLWKLLVLLWSLCWSSMVNIANFRNVQPDHFITPTTLTTSSTSQPQPRTTICKKKNCLVQQFLYKKLWGTTICELDTFEQFAKNTWSRTADCKKIVCHDLQTIAYNDTQWQNLLKSPEHLFARLAKK